MVNTASQVNITNLLEMFVQRCGQTFEGYNFYLLTFAQLCYYMEQNANSDRNIIVLLI